MCLKERDVLLRLLCKQWFLLYMRHMKVLWGWDALL